MEIANHKKSADVITGEIQMPSPAFFGFENASDNFRSKQKKNQKGEPTHRQKPLATVPIK